MSTPVLGSGTTLPATGAVCEAVRGWGGKAGMENNSSTIGGGFGWRGILKNRAIHRLMRIKITPE